LLILCLPVMEEAGVIGVHDSAGAMPDPVPIGSSDQCTKNIN